MSRSQARRATLDRPAGERRSAWIPWAFVAFFVIVFAANGLMVFFSFESWTGISTEDAYRRGIAYNRVLDEARAHEALGWKLTVDFEPRPDEGARRGRLLARLVDRDGAPLPGARVSARIVRPTHEGYDRSVTFEDLGGGRYEAALALPLPGQWEVRLDARRGENRVIAVSRIEVPQ